MSDRNDGQPTAFVPIRAYTAGRARARGSDKFDAMATWSTASCLSPRLPVWATSRQLGDFLKLSAVKNWLRRLYGRAILASPLLDDLLSPWNIGETRTAATFHVLLATFRRKQSGNPSATHVECHATRPDQQRHVITYDCSFYPMLQSVRGNEQRCMPGKHPNGRCAGPRVIVLFFSMAISVHCRSV